MKTSKGKLQKNYSSFEEFEGYCDIYNLHTRLGYNTPQEAWDDNPRIQWSTDPADFKRVDAPTTIQIFNFWRENKLDQHFQLTGASLIVKWCIWVEKWVIEDPERGYQWYDYYYGEKAVRCFITDAVGLNSTFEESEFPDIYKTLKPHF